MFCLLAAISLADFLNPLALFGFAAQFVFLMRFIVQWLASERRGRSYVPEVFWWISLAGGVMLFTYALLREDPVFMCGQLLGVGIYSRNLVLIYRRKGRRWQRRAESTLPPAQEPADSAASAPPARD